MASRSIAIPANIDKYDLSRAEVGNNLMAVGYGNFGEDKPLEAVQFLRPKPSPNQVTIKIMYSGVCHSDWHVILNEYNNSVYPAIPGHEIAGEVVMVGEDVKKFQIGELALIGPYVDSCGYCDNCEDHQEQYCENGHTATYNGQERMPGDIKPTGRNTYGGYSNLITVDERFVFKLPTGLDIRRSAPILCAGVTTYTALRQMNVRPGMKVGIAGIGGLGHMAIKYAAAMGAEVIALTTTSWKVDDSLKMGAHEAVLVSDKFTLVQYMGKLDAILCTIPGQHDADQYAKLLKTGGWMWIVGAIFPLTIDFYTVMLNNLRLASSNVGSPADTEECLAFSAEHGIMPDCQFIEMDMINETVADIKGKDVRYRYVIDMTNFGDVK